MVRTKFQICHERSELPDPSADEILALVWLLKSKNIKLPAIVAYALRLFARFQDKTAIVFQYKDKIIANLDYMIQHLLALNA